MKEERKNGPGRRRCRRRSFYEKEVERAFSRFTRSAAAGCLGWRPGSKAWWVIDTAATAGLIMQLSQLKPAQKTAAAIGGALDAQCRLEEAINEEAGSWLGETRFCLRRLPWQRPPTGFKNRKSPANHRHLAYRLRRSQPSERRKTRPRSSARLETSTSSRRRRWRCWRAQRASGCTGMRKSLPSPSSHNTSVMRHHGHRHR